MIKFSANTKEIDGLARSLLARSSDMSEAMAAIAGVMLDAVEENFEQEGRPETWTPLAEETVEERRRKGFGPRHPILQRMGTLAASIQAQSSGTEALVHSNLRYAAIQHFGGKAGRGKKVTIPPRPFMVLTREDEDEIAGILKEALRKL